METLFPLSPDMESFQLVYSLLLTLVHVAFAAGVARDAGHVVRYRGGTILVGPYVWAFATLVGGVLVGVAYWLVHHVLAPYQKNLGGNFNSPE